MIQAGSQRGRKIGLGLATLLVTGNMVGSGIYLLPASLAGVGSVSIVGWVVATAGALAIAGVLAYLGRVAPLAGGLCSYADEALGPYGGFEANIFYWLCAWFGNVAIALAAISYLAFFIPILATPAGTAVGTIALIWLATLVNIFGPRFACQLQSLTSFVGLIPILLVATLGWVYFSGHQFAEAWDPGGEPLLKTVPNSLVLVFWAFLGLESASIGTAIVEDPARNVPRATLMGVSLAAIVYIASCSAIMGIVPIHDLANSTAPFADAVRLMIGPAAGGIVAMLAFLKASGTLCGWVLMTAQTGKAGSERGFLPSILARTDQHDIPVTNLIVMAVLMSAVTLATISPTLNAQFNALIEMSVVLSLLTYMYACPALWRLPAATAPPESRRYQLLGVIALLFCGFVIARSGTLEILLAGAIIVVTSGWYFFLQATGRVRPERAANP
jgi:arginine:agmatine antiporter